MNEAILVGIGHYQPPNQTSRIFIPSSQEMRKKYFAIITVIYLIAGGFVSVPVKENATTTIRFKNRVGNKELVLFDTTYTNPFGEPFVISKFR